MLIKALNDIDTRSCKATVTTVLLIQTNKEDIMITESTNNSITNQLFQRSDIENLTKYTKRTVESLKNASRVILSFNSEENALLTLFAEYKIQSKQAEDNECIIELESIDKTHSISISKDKNYITINNEDIECFEETITRILSETNAIIHERNQEKTFVLYNNNNNTVKLSTLEQHIRLAIGIINIYTKSLDEYTRLDSELNNHNDGLSEFFVKAINILSETQDWLEYDNHIQMSGELATEAA